MTYDRAWLEAEWAAGRRPEFLLFWGHQSKKDGRVSKSCFSQWFVAPVEIDGAVYPTTEHWMMASKARLFDDVRALEAVFAAETPKEAKAAGRAVRDFDVDRWDAEKRSIVTIGNRAKFTQHPDLREFLLGTGDVVIAEASPYDDVWGIGLSSEDADAVDPTKWRGENLLGFVLMDVRDTLRG